MLFCSERWTLRDELHSEAFVLMQPVRHDAWGGTSGVNGSGAGMAACPVKSELSGLLLAFSRSLVLTTGCCWCSWTSHQLPWPVPVLMLCLLLCSKRTGTGT